LSLASFANSSALDVQGYIINDTDGDSNRDEKLGT
jgi:hypothetical protein